MFIYHRHKKPTRPTIQNNRRKGCSSIVVITVCDYMHCIQYDVSLLLRSEHMY